MYLHILPQEELNLKEADSAQDGVHLGLERTPLTCPLERIIFSKRRRGLPMHRTLINPRKMEYKNGRTLYWNRQVVQCP